MSFQKHFNFYSKLKKDQDIRKAQDCIDVPAIRVCKTTTMERQEYPKVMAQKQIMLSHPKVKRDEDGTDWCHFNLILATADFTKAPNTMEALHIFWRALFPYLFNLMKAYDLIRQNWMIEIEDQNKLLKKSAEYMTDNKWLHEYLKITDQLEDFTTWQREESKKVNIKSDKMEA